MRLYKVGMSVFCNSFGARAGRLANSRSLQLFRRGRRNHDLSRGRRRASSRGAMNVFDRTAKRRQKNRAYASPDAQTYDYIRNEVASQIVDRVCDVARYFPLALDMGCGRSHIATATTSDVTGCLVQCDMAENALLSRSPSSSSPRVPVEGAVVDEEHCSLPFSDNTFDLIMSSLSLHWVNDLPGALKEAWRVLRPDSPLVGAMFAGDTLFELRSSLQLAEMEREGGFSPHVSPFVQVSDIGGLLNRAGFTITTIDMDEIQVNYPSMYELMQDLKGMGESNCAWNRRHYIRRSTLTAAAAIYHDMFENDKGVSATFQILYFIGWKPDPLQRGPAPRGSAGASLRDIGSHTT